jgi:hypothetical protein
MIRNARQLKHHRGGGVQLGNLFQIERAKAGGVGNFDYCLIQKFAFAVIEFFDSQ